MLTAWNYFTIHLRTFFVGQEILPEFLVIGVGCACLCCYHTESHGDKALKLPCTSWYTVWSEVTTKGEISEYFLISKLLYKIFKQHFHARFPWKYEILLHKVVPTQHHKILIWIMLFSASPEAFFFLAR